MNALPDFPEFVEQTEQIRQHYSKIGTTAFDEQGDDLQRIVDDVIQEMECIRDNWKAHQYHNNCQAIDEQVKRLIHALEK